MKMSDSNKYLCKHLTVFVGGIKIKNSIHKFHQTRNIFDFDKLKIFIGRKFTVIWCVWLERNQENIIKFDERRKGKLR